MKSLNNYIFLPLLVILLQVMVVNQMHITWFATPFLYIWLVLRLPNDLPKELVTTLGFIWGLTLDMLCNTPGMQAFALTTLAYFKSPLLYLFVGRDDFKVGVIGVKSLGLWVYLRFLVVSSLFFTSIIYTFESFSFFVFKVLIVKILTSTLTTILLILTIESLKPHTR